MLAVLLSEIAAVYSKKCVSAERVCGMLAWFWQGRNVHLYTITIFEKY